MDLKLRDVAKILQVSEKTIYRWIKDNKIPYYRINHQYRFRTDEIDQWAVVNKIDFTGQPDRSENSTPITIVQNLQEGGIYYHVSGKDVHEVLANSVELLNLPSGLKADEFLTGLINREEMASTGVGNGIAFPHPRNPVVPDITSERMFLCFLHESVDFNALDGKPVNILFIILSADQTRHLRLLAKLSHLCRRHDFVKLLQKVPLRNDIFSYLGKQENNPD